MKHRPPYQRLGALFILVTSASLSAFGQTNLLGTNAAPLLAPPYGEIKPTFWESHGTAFIIAAIVAILVAAVVIYLALQPRRRVPPMLALVARNELAQLSGKPEDAACLSAVSQVLRRYFIGVFRLGYGEMNTAEFCAAMEAKPGIGADLAKPVADFLRQCDERKFSPKPGAPPLGAVNQAEDFLARAEARRAASQPPTA